MSDLPTVTGDVPLTLTPDEALEVDSSGLSRAAYVLSHGVVLDYLRTPATTTAEKKDKAALALGYIKHAETSLLHAAALGRSKQDDRLREEVAELRARLKSASKKAVAALPVETT